MYYLITRVLIAVWWTASHFQCVYPMCVYLCCFNVCSSTPLIFRNWFFQVQELSIHSFYTVSVFQVTKEEEPASPPNLLLFLPLHPLLHPAPHIQHGSEGSSAPLPHSGSLPERLPVQHRFLRCRWMPRAHSEVLQLQWDPEGLRSRATLALRWSHDRPCSPWGRRILQTRWADLKKKWN